MLQFQIAVFLVFWGVLGFFCLVGWFLTRITVSVALVSVAVSS